MMGTDPSDSILSPEQQRARAASSRSNEPSDDTTSGLVGAPQPNEAHPEEQEANDGPAEMGTKNNAAKKEAVSPGAFPSGGVSKLRRGSVSTQDRKHRYQSVKAAFEQANTDFYAAKVPYFLFCFMLDRA